MGGSVSIANQTDKDLTVSLWQVGPLNHFNQLKPNCWWRAETGKVWFTLKVWEHDRDRELTGWSVAKPIVLCCVGVSAITLAAVAALPAALTAIPAAATTTTLSVAAAGEKIVGSVAAVTGIDTAAVSARSIRMAAAVGTGSIRMVISDSVKHCDIVTPGIYAHGDPKFVVFSDYNKDTKQPILCLRKATKEEEALLFDERSRRL